MLLDGYKVVDDRIIDQTTEMFIYDRPITVISFSVRAANVLERMEIDTVSKLICVSEEELINTRNLGRKTKSEIFEKLSEYLKESFASPSISQSCTYEDRVDRVLFVPDFMDSLSKFSIDELSLSTRPKNMLNRFGLTRISDISDFTLQDFLKLSFMGEKAAKEAYSKTAEFKSNHRMSGSIFDEGGKLVAIPDQPIKSLSIDNKIINKLFSAGVVFAGDFDSMDKNEMDQLLDSSEIDEVSLSVDNYKKTAPILYEVAPDNEKEEVEIAYLLKIVIRAKREIEAYKIDCSMERFDYLIAQIRMRNPLTLYLLHSIDDIYSSEPIENAFSGHIIKLLSQNEIEGLALESITAFFPDSASHQISRILNKLVAEKSIRLCDEKYYLNFPLFSDYILASDGRDADIIRMRIQNITLEEIGSRYSGLTRERIRQIEQKFMSTALSKVERFDEDKYSYLYCTYKLNEDDSIMRDYLGLSEAAVYYLNYKHSDVRYDNNRVSLEKIVNDEHVPPSIHRALDKYLRNTMIFISGKYVPATRSAVEDALFPIYCKNRISFEEFIARSNDFVTEQGYPYLAASDNQLRTRENFAKASSKILWTLNRRMRYYDLGSFQADSFYSALCLEQYGQVELSSKKLFVEHEELMQEYDIQDEYELHYLMKKTIGNRYPRIDLGRPPVINFGKADRKKQIEDLLMDLAPVTADEYVDAYCELYGMQRQTVYANYLPIIKQYKNHEKYEVDVIPLSESEISHLKPILSEGFYTIDDVKRHLKKEFPNAPEERINHFSLRQLGFNIYSGYVIDSQYSSAVQYFETLINSKELLDLSLLSPAVMKIQAFTHLLAEYTSEYKLIEYMPKKYISLKRLKELFGITIEDILNFCCEVKVYTLGNYFTVKSLYKSGFASKLDELGFDDYFYMSILAEDHEDFSCKRIGRNKIFQTKCNGSFAVSDFIETLIYQEKRLSVDIHELIDLLWDQYAICLDKYKITSDILAGTSMYYNEVTERVYADYEIYFDEM